MTTLAQIDDTQAAKAAAINEINRALAPAALFGERPAAHSGLVFGYYGGVLTVDGVLTTLADGTVTLTASSTNYVEATRAGVVSRNTTGFTAGRLRLFVVATTGSAISSVEDVRTLDAMPTGLVSFAVTGSDVTLTAAQADCDILECTGTLTGNRSVIVPLGPKPYVVLNGTSGAFSLTVKTAAGSGVAVVQGTRTLVYTDGTNVAEVTPPALIPVDFTQALNLAAGSITAAATTDLAGINANDVQINHTTDTIAIAALGTLQAGALRTINFNVAGGTLTLTHNATALELPGVLNVIVANGDRMIAVSKGGGNWRVVSYTRADGVSGWGTFTPVVAGMTTAGTCTYVNQTGAWEREGRLLYFNLDVDWSGHTGTGQMSITGLPFNCVASPYGGALPGYSTIGFTGWASGLIVNGETRIRVYDNPSVLTLPAVGAIGFSGVMRV
jgi:hypothetical protein